MSNGEKLTVLSSAPVNDSTLVGWRVTVRNVFSTSPIITQVRVHVICAKVELVFWIPLLVTGQQGADPFLAGLSRFLACVSGSIAELRWATGYNVRV